MLEFVLLSLEDTKKIAQKLAQNAKIGDVFLLFGNLGSGKTTFSKFFIQSFFKDHTLNVTSPTFPIIQTYGPNNELWHIDLYRIENQNEIYNLGLEEAEERSIMLIEWPERLMDYLPVGNIVNLEFSIEGANRKLIHF